MEQFVAKSLKSGCDVDGIGENRAVNELAAGVGKTLANKPEEQDSPLHVNPGKRPLRGAEATVITRDDFASVYATKFDQIVGQLRRRGTELAQASDGVQDAFCICWQRRRQLRDKRRLAGWVAISAMNRAYSSARRNRRVAEWPANYEPATPPANDVDSIAVRETLERLSLKDKRLLEMAYWEGLSCAEIAEAREFEDYKTTDAVYCALSRARKRFKARFSGCSA